MTKRRLDQTPRLGALLAALRARLVRRTWVDGLGRVLVLVGLWVGATFLLDWSLELPRALRLLLLVGLGAAVATVVWRRLVLVLRAVPDRAGLAVLAERGAARREELLVSAVQLQEAERLEAPSPLALELEAAVCRRAEEVSATVDTRVLVEERRPLVRLALGGLAVALAALPLLLSPLAAVFLARLLGSADGWPQRTTLELEVVSGALVEQDGEDLLLTVARGGDVTLAVRAIGVQPKEVELASRSALPQILLPGGDGVFRAVLRSITRDDVLSVSGGDDDDGSPRARILVVDPPDLTAIVIEVEPPAYTGLPVKRFVDTGASAVVGSTVRLWAATRPSDAAAQLLLLPTNRSVAPARAAPPAGLEDVLGTQDVLVHEFPLEESLRLRFDLSDARGLTNPDPGLFAIDAIVDRAPELVRLVPTRSDAETSSIGAVRVVLTVRDDFGVDSVQWLARSGSDGPVLAQGEMLPFEVPEGARDEWHATLRLDIGPILGEGEGAGGQLEFEFLAADRAVPPHVGRDTSLRVRVLSGDELLRRAKDRLAKARALASRLSERLLESRRRCEELADLIDASGASTGEELSGLRTALALARRTESDGQNLLRELTSVCEMVLYARLDEKAEGLLTALDRELAGQRSRSFEIDPWRNVIAEQKNSVLAAEGFGAHLVSIAAIGVELVDGPLGRSATALDDAGAARDTSMLEDALARSALESTAALALVESLLERLAEWDNYQSVLSLTRDLLDRQKALSERTRRFASDR